MLSLEDNLSIATSIVDFMRQNNLQRFNASEITSFKRCSIVGVSPQGGIMPESFKLIDKMKESMWHLVNPYSDNELKKLRQAVSSGDPQYNYKYQPLNDWYEEFHCLIHNGQLTWTYKGGTCAGFSAIVVCLLILLNIPCEVISAVATKRPGLRHKYVVIGRKTDSDVRDITTWGDNYVIIDAWDRFKVTHKKLIDKFPEDNLFFLPTYQKDWSWKVFLTIDRPDIIFSQHRFLHLLDAEYQKIIKLISPELRIFKPTVYSLTLFKQILMASPTEALKNIELLALARKHDFYDRYRLKIMTRNLNDEEHNDLIRLSALVGEGVRRALIETPTDTHPDFFSINRLWLDYQLSDKNRAIIKHKAKISTLTLSLEDNLSIATSVVNFMRKNGLQRFNASEDASFQPCSSIGIRTQGGITGVVPDTFELIHEINASLSEVDVPYVHIHLKKLMLETHSIDRDDNKCRDLSLWYSQFHFFIQGGRLTWEYKGGTCFGFSGIVITLLTLLNIPCEAINGVSIKKFNHKFFDHVFVVIGRKTDSDLRDITTWGNDYVIIDAWDRFKVTHKKLIDEFPEDNIFFLPKYRTDWNWKLLLTSDKPNIIFKEHKALPLLDAEYKRIINLILPAFKTFRPTDDSLWFL